MLSAGPDHNQYGNGNDNNLPLAVFGDGMDPDIDFVLNTGKNRPFLNDVEAPMSVSPRLDSVDLLRGLVMVIMALDHVRDFFTNAEFSPTDLSQTSAVLFFTRWITHFCAPVFFFLAGTGAFLSLSRGRSRSELACYLLTRGLCLVILELTVISFAWTFNVGWPFIELAVIWALGWSMVILAGLVFLPLRAITAIGLLMIFTHNLLDRVNPEDFSEPDGTLGWRAWLFSVLHFLNPPVIYPLIPWVGVMAVGFAFGAVLPVSGASRLRLILLGISLSGAFIILRWANLYGDPAPWSFQHSDLFTVMSFLNTTKYPPSMLYLLMTLGPPVVLLALVQNVTNPLSRFLIIFGRVPLFFYILHLYLIHGLALIAGVLTGYDASALLTFPFYFPPGYGFSLPVVYLIWILVIAALYPICAWFARVKARRTDALLGYF